MSKNKKKIFVTGMSILGTIIMLIAGQIGDVWNLMKETGVVTAEPSKITKNELHLLEIKRNVKEILRLEKLNPKINNYTTKFEIGDSIKYLSKMIKQIPSLPPNIKKDNDK